jgi:hypothetical protein
MISNTVIQTLFMIAIMSRRQRAERILAKVHERAQYARIVDRINGEQIDRNAKVVCE